MAEGDELIQGVVVVDKEDHEMVLWYSEPTVSAEVFGETTNRLTEYKLKIMLGDFNDRHPAWCTRHDENKKGLQLIKEAGKETGYKIHAKNKPTFQAQRNRNRGTFGSSTMDLLVSQVPVNRIARLEGKIAERSDHFPIWFSVEWQVKNDDSKAHPKDAPTINSDESSGGADIQSLPS